jgi:hypothetical protein
MSIFGRIKDAILGHAEAAPEAESSPAPVALADAPEAAADNEPIDMVPILDKMVASKGVHLDWRHSIVDLLKALDMDSSLDKRKELATELGYTGALDGSAEMNMWLHGHVMARLAGEGVKTPE